MLAYSYGERMVSGGQLCTRCSWRVTEAGYGLGCAGARSATVTKVRAKPKVLVTDVVTERVPAASMAPVCLVEVCCGQCLLRAGALVFRVLWCLFGPHC